MRQLKEKKKDLNIFVAFIINLGEGIVILAKISLVLRSQESCINYPSLFILLYFLFKNLLYYLVGYMLYRIVPT